MHAYDKGAECLAPSVELVQSALLQSIQDDGRWSSNELSNIIAVSTLIKTGYSGHEVDKAIEHIIKRQDDDGGWENAIAFPDLYNPVFYGSRELVTASALQALYLFNRSN
jgi:hypothetical protein